jgi:ArsR family transcriptional regulator
VKLLYQLLDGEKCVGEIAEAVGISQSATSHQLRFLKEKGVVGNRRAGQSIFYRLFFRLMWLFRFCYYLL